MKGQALPASSFATFTDPYPYQKSVRAGELEIATASKGDFRAELTRINLHRLWMQRSSERLPRISRMLVASERAAIFFLTSEHQPAILINGVETSPGKIVVSSRGATHHHRTSAPFQWGAMSMSHEDLAKTGRALVGRELGAPPVTTTVRPRAQLMSRLMKLHEAAGNLARTAPDILAKPEVARALEQALVHAMIECLTDGTPSQMGAGPRQRLAAMVRFEELLTANPDRPLYLTEICAAVGVSERTLRLCCQESLGMGPHRYLLLRRMHLARRALALADPSTATVTVIATQYGFWELGRFSVAYGKLFGESPSDTLRRVADGSWASLDRPFAFAVAESA
jgi:AraC-like DNA-binding protein